MSLYQKYHFAHLTCRSAWQGPREQVAYHADFLRFHTQLVERAKHAGKMFHADHAEEFKTAAFPALLDDLDEGERSIVDELFKGGRRADEVIWQVINYRMYRQIQAIARGSGTMEGIGAWVHLFNSFMRCGAAATGGEGALHIYCTDGEGFARYFLQHLMTVVRSDRQGFEPFRVEAADIGRLLDDCSKGIPLDDPSFGRFIQWVDLYESLIEQDFEE